MARDADISRFMSLALRHDPAAAGIALDEAGWTDFDALCRSLHARFGAGPDEVRRIVEESPKRRFTIEGGRIRAAQGHSVAVELGLERAAPPDRLFHATTAAALAAIGIEGLRRGARRHVHLSTDFGTARTVGARHHGETVILSVDAARMAADGLFFFRADNGVWLTESVPPAYIEVLEGPKAV